MKACSSRLIPLLFVLFASLTVAAQTDGEPQSPTPTSTPAPCAPVSLAGIEVVCFSRGVGSVTKTERAKLVVSRLSTLSADPEFDTAAIVAHRSDENEFVLEANGIVILSLKEGDSRETNDQELETFAEEVAQRARSAISADRVIRSPNAIMMGGLKSLGATLIFILILYSFNWFFPKAHSYIEKSHGKFIRSIRIQTFEILKATHISRFLHWVVSAVRIFSTFLAVYIFIPLVLSFFPWTSSWSAKLFGYIITPFITFLNVILNYIPNLFFIAAIILCTRYLMKIVRFFFVEIDIGNLRFEGFYREWAIPTYKLVRVIILAFAFVMAFPYLPGSSSPAFQGVSVFLGLLLSLGSSSAIANIVAGVVLTYMRPFKIGDRVKIADTIGDVLEKTLLVTRIKTIKHVEVTIPNSMVLGSHIVNYSSAASNEGLILNTSVTIGYDVPWREVHKLLIAAAERTSQIETSKKPFVLQTALNDFYVSYELNAFTAHSNQMATIYSELHSNIQDCFFEAGVEIMSPHYSALRDGDSIAIPESYKTK